MEKIIIITGASSDLGMAYIKENAEDYDKIIAHYHHGSERFESLLSTYNDKITAIHAILINDLYFKTQKFHILLFSCYNPGNR